MKHASAFAAALLLAAFAALLLLRFGASVSPSPPFVGTVRAAPTPAPVLPPLRPAPANLPPRIKNATPARYRITALPVFFAASALNNKSEIAGTLDISDTGVSTKAQVWKNGKIRDLPPLDKMPTTTADCISDNGIVGGTAEDQYSGAISVFESHTVLWNATAKHPVPRPVGNDLSAQLFAVNAHGQAVGASSAASVMEEEDTQWAFFWDGKKSILLGDTAHCRAYGLSERGQVVGEEDGKMVLWQENEKRVLGDGAAYFINNRGQIAGTSDFGRKAKVMITGHLSGNTFVSTDPPQPPELVLYPMTHALLWENNKTTDLGVLPNQYFSGVGGLNDRGQIVGTCTRQNRYQYNFDQNQNRAFLWQAGIMMDLNRLLPPHSGWNLFAARGINNAGHIIGSGTFRGKKRDFILTPR